MPLAALAAPYQVTLTDYLSPINGIIKPAWLRENNELVVPLTELARTGLIDPLVEEGLLTIAGNRFSNEIYKGANGTSSLASWHCLSDCGTTIALAVPCLFAAVTSGRPEDVLKCVGKQTLCGCHDCLPGPIDRFVEQKICSNGNLADTTAKFSPYVDFSALASSSVSVAAFRGDLYKYQVEQLAALNKAGASGVQVIRGDGEVHAQCVVGSGCGGCGCCVGGCVFDTCVGVCAG